MEDRQLRSILEQFISYRNQARLLLNKVWSLEDVQTQVNVSMPQPARKSDTLKDIKHRIYKLERTSEQLIQSYNNQYYDIAKKTEVNLKYIKFDIIESALTLLIIECDKIIGALEGEVSILSSKEIKKQEELRNETAEICKNIDPLYEENLSEALTEIESGHFLASALITSRIIDDTLKKLNIQDNKQDIKKIIKSAANEKSDTILKQQTETISRLSRNLYNHRIDRFPKSSQAFSLLSGVNPFFDTNS